MFEERHLQNILGGTGKTVQTSSPHLCQIRFEQNEKSRRKSDFQTETLSEIDTNGSWISFSNLDHDINIHVRCYVIYDYLPVAVIDHNSGSIGSLDSHRKSVFKVGLFCAEFMEIQAKSYNFLKEFLDLIQAAIAIATIITILCEIRNIYLFLMNYKRDILLMYKGDRSFIPTTVQTPSPNVYMAQGMRFIGTSITGMLLGTVFCFLLVFVPLALMMMIIRILNESGKLKDIWSQFQWLVYPVCMIIIFKLQVFLIGKFFLQPKIDVHDKYRPLAVDNRNAYDVVSFFMIFLNASIGLIAFLKRILVGAFLGVFLIPRMDRSLLMRGYESMDKCYVNYIGMLMVDVTHNHPVMRVFCALLKESVEKRRDRKPLHSAVENPEYGQFSNSQTMPLDTRNTVGKRRWWLAYTLIRNPRLVSMRAREVKSRRSEKSSLDLNDIQCTDTDTVPIVAQENSDDSWRFKFRCCMKYKCTVPPNIVMNLMALVVLVSILVIYAGFPVLISNFMQEVSSVLAGN